MTIRIHLILSTFVLVCWAATGLADDVPNAAARKKIVDEIVKLTNIERAKENLPPFKVNDLLTKAAQGHSDNMAKQNKLDHTLDEKDVGDRLTAVGYKFSAWAENIAMGQPDAAAALKSWMNSEGHRDNILSKTVTEIGVGLAYDAKGQPYYTQTFGQPR